MMNNDCPEDDELLQEMADYKKKPADMAAVRLFRKCSTSWLGSYICENEQNYFRTTP